MSWFSFELGKDGGVWGLARLPGFGEGVRDDFGVPDRDRVTGDLVVTGDTDACCTDPWRCSEMEKKKDTVSQIC